MNSGSWEPLRQPSWPPSSAVWLFELAIASWPKSSPLAARAAISFAFLVMSSSCCGVAACGSDSRMCETLNSSLAAADCLAREKLLELVRRHVDVRDHVALPQACSR